MVDLSKNKRKTFFVGDIHGCFWEFSELLKKIKYNKENYRLILLGDLINRGPNSFEVLKWVREKEVEVIMGNHERGFLISLKEGFPLGNHFMELKNQMGESLEGWINWIKNWPHYIEGEDFIAVHGGLVPGESPKQSDSRILANIRTWDGKGINLIDENNPPWYKSYKGKKTVVYGHWAKQGLKIRENTIGLDTGCVYGYQLSGLLWPERRVIQVSARKNYYP